MHLPVCSPSFNHSQGWSVQASKEMETRGWENRADGTFHAFTSAIAPDVEAATWRALYAWNRRPPNLISRRAEEEAHPRLFLRCHRWATRIAPCEPPLAQFTR